MKWLRRGLLFLSVWLIIFFFFFGPGRVLIPSLLLSYASVTDKTNTVYYSGNRIEKALDVLWMASVVQDSIRRFWNDSGAREFWKGVTIFLCESPSQYYHLTWNRAMGSALMGRIVLNPRRVEVRMSLYSALVHEMSHLYMSRRFGYFPHLFLLPKWFDEGCATVMQDYSYPANNLERWLQQNPTLVYLSGLKHPWDWQSMVLMEEGEMAGKGYGQVYRFTRFLQSEFGQEKIREYGSRLGWNFLPGRTFRKTFGRPLEEVESQWLAEQKSAGAIPPDTHFIPLSLNAGVCLRWILVALVIITPVVILIWYVVPALIKLRRKQ